MSEDVRFPNADAIFSAVKSSCHECRIRAGLTIDPEAITTFLTALSTKQEQWSQFSKDHGTKLPLKFDSLLQEVNLLALLELLNFCSGYRVELKQLTGRGAFDTIRALIFSLHISQTDLSSAGLEHMTSHDIANMAQLPVSEDVDHPTLQGVQLGRPTKLAKMAEDIAHVLSSTGQILRRGGIQSLGAFVIECTKRSKVEDKGVSASQFVYRMVEAIPGFRDMALVDGEPVYLFKKIQLLTQDLYERFSTSHPDMFNFYDIDELTIFSDNVIPTILHHLNIIRLDIPDNGTPRQVGIIKGLQEDLRTGRETTTERSYVFRAAAVDACEIIVQTAKNLPNSHPFVRNMTAERLDAYLWQLAKKGALRDIVRFSDPNTIFF